MRTLRLGSSGEDVKGWQQFLVDAKLFQGSVDGRFGASTAEATRAFQRVHQLKDDGVAGNKTLGTAMQLGLDLAPEDPPVPTPLDGVVTLNDAWQAPSRAETAELVIARDPRVVVAHQPGMLPCPRNPPPPVGWVYWTGPVPEALGKLAVKVEFHPAEFPMGSFVQAVLDGTRVAARVEWHDFRGATGKHGCFRGTSLFRPQSGA
jgi:peptidoglycan hydrolase-like protein with peptidoglycan-binding domain